METRQAKALLKHTIANKPLMCTVEGFLGVDSVPADLQVFDSSKPEDLDRCIAFLSHYIDALSIAREECIRRPPNPRQTTTDQQIDKAKGEGISAAEKAERQKVSKGSAEGRAGAVAAVSGGKPPKGQKAAKKKAGRPKSKVERQPERFGNPIGRRGRKAAAGISRSRRGKGAE